MKIYNIHETKTNFSRILEGVESGESVVIARAGKPIAKLSPIGEKPPQRIGFMEGAFEVPDDIDSIFAGEIHDLFYGGELEPKTKNGKTGHDA